MARIAFLQDDLAYIGSDLHTRYLRGIENCTIRLSRGFARLGHDVTVFTEDERRETCDGVQWMPLNAAKSQGRFDLIIANNNPVLFDQAQGENRVVWVHNPTKPWRLIKKKRFGAMLRYRPAAVMGSDDVRRAISKAVPYAKRHVIQHGVGDVFLEHTKPRTPPPPVAIFLSMTYRGLGPVVEIWRDHVLPRLPDARLIILAAPEDRHVDEALELKGVSLQARFPDPRDLAVFMAQARVHLFPGHRDETFCNAAAEASACGVPLVTSGYGALKERVIHGVSGYLETDPTAYGSRIIEILSDDSTWEKLHQGALTHPDVCSWDHRAEQWSELFL